MLAGGGDASWFGSIRGGSTIVVGTTMDESYFAENGSWWFNFATGLIRLREVIDIILPRLKILIGCESDDDVA